MPAPPLVWKRRAGNVNHLRCGRCRRFFEPSEVDLAPWVTCEVRHGWCFRCVFGDDGVTIEAIEPEPPERSSGNPDTTAPEIQPMTEEMKRDIETRRDGWLMQEGPDASISHSYVARLRAHRLELRWEKHGRSLRFNILEKSYHEALDFALKSISDVERNPPKEGEGYGIWR